MNEKFDIWSLNNAGGPIMALVTLANPGWGIRISKNQMHSPGESYSDFKSSLPMRIHRFRTIQDAFMGEKWYIW